MIQDLAALLWVINLGCIDLNQWYATCDDVDRPDYLHFDLDPGAGAAFERVIETAQVVHEALDTLKMPSVVKTTGSKGLHIYVPIVRGPEQKQVWTFAKALAHELAVAQSGADHRPSTASPSGRTAACWSTTTRTAGAARWRPIYSVRPRPEATVSTPVTWKELDKGVPDRGLHGDERAGARREGRRPVEAAAAGARPRRPVGIRLRPTASERSEDRSRTSVRATLLPCAG